METIHLKKNIEPELTLGQWFKNVVEGVKTTLKGMGITFKYVWGHETVTIEYPEVREELPANSRSRLFNDVENCISCMQCANACPVSCIYITATKRPADAPKIKTKDGTPIRLDLKQYTIDTALCCYCGICTTVCPTECLTHTTDYEFSSYTLASMKYDYLEPEIRAMRTRIVKDAAPMEPPAPAPVAAPVATAAAEAAPAEAPATTEAPATPATPPSSDNGEA